VVSNTLTKASNEAGNLEPARCGHHAAFNSGDAPHGSAKCNVLKDKS